MVKTTVRFEKYDFCFVISDYNMVKDELKENNIEVNLSNNNELIFKSEKMLNFRMGDTLSLKEIDWDLMVKPISINIEF